MYININRADNVTYKLHYNNELFVVQEKIDWSNVDYETERDLILSGFNYNLSNNIVFFGLTADFLKSIYEEKGIDANVKLIYTDSNGKDSLINYLDFYEYDKSKEKVTIKLSDKGYRNLIQTNFDKNIELDREDDLYGKKLEPLGYKTLFLKGRSVLKLSDIIESDKFTLKFRYLDDINNPDSFKHYIPIYDYFNVDSVSQGNLELLKVRGDLAFSLNKTNGNDEQIYNQSSDVENFGDDFQNVISGSEGIRTYRFGVKSIANTFFANNTRYTDKIHLTIDSKTKIRYKANDDIADNYAYSLSWKLSLSKYDFDYENKDLLKINEELILKNGNTIEVDDDEWIELDLYINKSLIRTVKRNEALSLEFKTKIDGYYIDGDYHSYSDNDYGNGIGFLVQTFIDNQWVDGLHSESINVKTSRKSRYKPTQHECLTLKSVVERYYNIIGVNNFKSDVLNNELDGIILVNGFMLRNFLRGTDDYKSITISPNELTLSIINTFGLGFGVENYGINEVARIEKRKYFYTDKIIDYTNIEIEVINEKPLKDLYFNTIKAGYRRPEVSNKYGDEDGLDEYNIKNEYSTPVKTKANNLDLNSTISADSLGIEKTRRQPFNENDKKDTQYDDTIWFVDCKEIKNGVFAPLSWGDVLISKPDGIYSRETAFNLRLTPLNILLNNIEYINAGLFKYTNDRLRLTSKGSTVNLVTKYENKTLVEGDDVLLRENKKRLFKAKLSTIKLDLSLINVQDNFNNLLSFKDKYNNPKRGYIYKVNSSENTITLIEK